MVKEIQRLKEILKILRREYPEAKCSLEFKTPFQLLAATILSAQCTDERVNKITPELFKKFPGPKEMAEAKVSEIEKKIRSCNFYKNKARALNESAQVILEKHKGQVPKKLEDLIQLRGVGRKTANVVLGVAYGVPGLVVDTHVGRLSRRLGFTDSSDPEIVEQELMQVVPKKDWIDYAHLMIDHGRAICTARRAYCEECFVAHLCPKIGVLPKRPVR